MGRPKIRSPHWKKNRQIRAMAQQIQSPEQFEFYLSQIEDPVKRTAVREKIRPMLRFTNQIEVTA